MASTPSRLDAVINLAKRRGFVFPCGEIYGGTRSAWDYGPLGVELKENIKRQWWQYMVRSRDDVVGLDSSVILPRETWVASGHVGAFTDPLVESLHTHKRYRADQLIEDYAARKGLDPQQVEQMDYKAYKEQQYDILADAIRRSLDMDKVYQILEEGAKEERP